MNQGQNFKMNISKKFQLLIVTLMSLFLLNSAHADNPPVKMFVDLLYLQTGVDESRVEEYFKRITPIVAKHGLRRMGGFKVTKNMMGNINPQFINLWVVEGEHTFKGIFSDKAYLKNVPFRNSIFDMNKAQMFMLTPTFNVVQYPDTNVK